MQHSLRTDIDGLIESGNLRELLSKAGELHGHLCSYLTYGVMAAYVAVRELEVKSTGMEELVAIVETNNCFSDGVQMVAGCSFGNNSLMYRDIGKTAVTVARRDGTAIRVALDPDFDDSRNDEYPEAAELWDRIIVKREEATLEEQERMMMLFAEMSVNELNKSTDKMFRIKRMKITVPEYAPIVASVRCSVCGEKVMESKARVMDGKPVCIDCGEKECWILDGKGLSMKLT